MGNPVERNPPRGRTAEGHTPPFVEAAKGPLFVLALAFAHILLLRRQDICLVETQAMCCVQSQTGMNGVR